MSESTDEWMESVRVRDLISWKFTGPSPTCETSSCDEKSETIRKTDGQ